MVELGSVRAGQEGTKIAGLKKTDGVGGWSWDDGGWGDRRFKLSRLRTAHHTSKLSSQKFVSDCHLENLETRKS